MTKSTTRRQIDIQNLLRKRRQVAVIWGIEDVQSRRPDLTHDEAWNVLQQCERIHDCNSGFTWDLIHSVADDLFPQSNS